MSYVLALSRISLRGRGYFGRILPLLNQGEIVAQAYQRTPKNYDGTRPTTHRLSDVLPAIASGLEIDQQKRPDLILAAWPEIIGPRLAPLAQAVRFEKGTLFVKVKNSSIYHLLSQYEKAKLLLKLQEKFPHSEICHLMFRLG